MRQLESKNASPHLCLSRTLGRSLRDKMFSYDSVIYFRKSVSYDLEVQSAGQSKSESLVYGPGENLIN